MTGEKRIKRFLFGINSNQQVSSQVFNDSEFTVEHILPKSDKHLSSWKGFKDEDLREWVNRIGNLTLLTRTDNKPGTKFNGSFEKKKEIYAESALAITRRLAQSIDWTPENIKERQRYMAKRAVESLEVCSITLDIKQLRHRAEEKLRVPSLLHNYQWEGVAFLYRSRSVLLADEMGLGKTVQTAVALALLMYAQKDV